jgi:hypothetical protein
MQTEGKLFMSIDYTLQIATDQEPADLFRSLVETCNFTKMSGEFVERDEVTAGVYSRAGTTSSDEVVRSIFQEEYGFTPSVAVWFQPSKFDKNFTSKAKYVCILQSVVTLLDHFPGNAALLYDEQTVLRRLNGHLEIDIRWYKRYEGISLEGLAPENFAYLNKPDVA